MRQQHYGDVRCEGCKAQARGLFSRRGRGSLAQSRFPSPPGGWSQCGRSRKAPGALAAWCPKCRSARRQFTYDDPSAQEVRAIAKADGR